jgi:tryptophanyl-tRNA synthetase
VRAQGHFTQKERPVPRTITGIKPTGPPHLGNYLGMIRPALDLARTSEALCFIADYHALTTVPPPGTIRDGVLDLAATLIAFGLDPERAVLYRQSDVPEICELTWILSCVCQKGLLNRAHAYKAAVQENVAAGRHRDHAVGMGVFSYPVLMAADILIHRAELVPVGSDQRQHVEIARDLAVGFNRVYGPVLVVPEPAIDERVMTIPGIDGRKMSKSYGNQIALSATPAEIRRRVFRIVTDSRPPSEPKSPDTILALYRQLGAPGEAGELARRYAAGEVSYAEAKAMLAEAIQQLTEPARERHAELMADPAGLQATLASGAIRARRSAAATLEAVRAATGLGWAERLNPGGSAHGMLVTAPPGRL